MRLAYFNNKRRKIMNIEIFLKIIKNKKTFFTGVPDSLLKPLCDYIYNTHGISEDNIVCANEGNCVALAAGHYLATGSVPVVYLQNSGIGNIINPYVSLLNEKVYGIPCIFVIGWRGEPGVHDEPQHIFQGERTLRFLEDADIATFVIDKCTTEKELQTKVQDFSLLLESGKSVAFLVRKGALEYEKGSEFFHYEGLNREDAIARIVAASGEDVIVSTTGKTSRELFEIRKTNKQAHKYDFLTVGSMGHSSSIALGIALRKPRTKVWCIDGDGAVMMHMGAMAVIGANSPNNLIHVVINNRAHESVGGMPTVADKIDFVKIAQACGYARTATVERLNALDAVLYDAKQSNELYFIEIKAAVGSRPDLGRPTSTPQENKKEFMKYLKECD